MIKLFEFVVKYFMKNINRNNFFHIIKKIFYRVFCNNGFIFIKKNF